jgi:hypothetical protein
MRSIRFLLLLAVGSLVSGCAAHTGNKAAEGALEAFRAPPAEGSAQAERIGRQTAEGFLDTFSSPDGLARISTIVDASVTRSLEAALRSPPGGGGSSGVGPARSIVGQVARESASAFGSAITLELARGLGPDGRGPLATTIGATASQVSGSAVRGVRGELDDLLAGCGTEDRRACVEAEVRSLGRAASLGFMEGLAASLAWPALGLAFALGVVLALVARSALGLLRRHPPLEHREAHS